MWKLARRSILLAVLLLAVADAFQQQSKNQADIGQDADSPAKIAAEQHPAPEPYSFSYSAESVGGQSSHQESGDGSGRVTGFYTIMGEDGRERRVDYVADENGYRATISTNEVGTRSESSADAQYSARLPSERQLEQAKVTLEQYKQLEETHANERQQQLARLASPSRNIQAQQQFQQASNQWSTASQQTSNFEQQQAFRRQQQQQQQQQQNSNNFATQQGRLTVSRQQSSATSNSQLEASGEQPVALGASASPDQPEPAEPAPAAAPQPAVNLIGPGSYAPQDDENWRSKAAGRLTGLPAEGANSATSSWSRQLSQSVQSVGEQQSGGNVDLSSDQSAGVQQQQSTQPAQRLDDSQQVQAASWQLVNRGAAPARKLSTVLMRQMEQQFMQQARQLTGQDYARRQPAPAQVTTENLAQAGQQQDLEQQGFANLQQSGQFLTGQLQQSEFQNQQQHQQSNIIDEMVDVNDQAVEQVEKGNEQQTVVQQPRQQVVTTTSQQPISATVPTTVRPTGLLTIDLADNREQQQQQLLLQNQEVDQKQRDDQVVVTTRPSTQFGYDQFVSQAGGQQKQQQQVEEVNEQNQQLREISNRPNSIKQIIEQQKGYAQKQQQLTVTKVSQVRPTTLAAPLVYQTTTTTTSPAPIVETTRGPVKVEPTTTTQTPPRKQVYVQPTTTTSTTTTAQTPAEVIYATTGRQTTAPIVLDTRPLVQQQQNYAVKGGARKQTSSLVRFNNRQESESFVPLRTNLNRLPVQPTSPRPTTTQSVSKQAEFNTQSSYSSGAAQVDQPTYPSDNQPAQEVTTTTTARQQQQVDSYKWQPQAPALPTTTQQQQQQQRIQQNTSSGTKGGSSKASSSRQQFWKQQAARVARANRPDPALFKTNIEPANPYYGARVAAASGASRQARASGAPSQLRPATSETRF